MARDLEPKPLVVVAGFSGWTRATWRAGTEDELTAFVRFARVEDSPHTLRPVELRVTEPSLRKHRDVPLSRIEHAVHADAYVRFELLEHIDYDKPIYDVPSMFVEKASVAKGMSPRYKLERPTKRRLDDAFYANVAQAYADAVAWGMNPRKTLAADSGIPADTVARWIREARRRKKLSPAEPGKASGALREGGGTDA